MWVDGLRPWRLISYSSTPPETLFCGTSAGARHDRRKLIRPGIVLRNMEDFFERRGFRAPVISLGAGR